MLESTTCFDQGAWVAKVTYFFKWSSVSVLSPGCRNVALALAVGYRTLYLKGFYQRLGPLLAEAKASSMGRGLRTNI